MGVANSRWASIMRIVLVDTYYKRFLTKHYADHPSLDSESYETQWKSLIGARFGTSDFYSKHLNDLGCEAYDLIANCAPLQSAWLKENGLDSSNLNFAVPHRFYRLPMIGGALAALPGFIDVVAKQVRSLKPDVLYCHDLSFFPKSALKELRRHARLIVGQIAYHLPPRSFVQGYDLILTSFPHFVPRIAASGVSSEYFRLGFDPRVASVFADVSRDIDVSFVGALGRSHRNAIPLLERLARETPIRIFGYGAEDLPANSPILQRYEKEVWGLEMYGVLARSKITINRHIGIAQNYANNMRLYEATGMGALLLTDNKDNLRDLFEPGLEVVTYSSPGDAVEKINNLLRHPAELAEIAAAGMARTLREHTYQARMKELLDILSRHLQAKDSGGKAISKSAPPATEHP
jgi:spore maturation protein CgeB